MKIMVSGPITSWQIEGGNMEAVTDFIFFVSKITVDGNCSHEIKRCLLLGRKAMTNLNSIFKSRDVTWPTKTHLINAMVFLVVMYRYESWTIKESWAPKNWCFWIVVLEKTPESPLDSREIKPVNPKGNQPWIFTGRIDAEAETPLLLATWCKELTHWKRPWCWERLKVRGEGVAEDEVVGWWHWLNGHGSEQTLGDSEGQGSLEFCSPWGCKELDTT